MSDFFFTFEEVEQRTKFIKVFFLFQVKFNFSIEIIIIIIFFRVVP